jgi:anaerobic magnesium-protoporphyrin IX monomethyl ester cyclase
MDKASGLKEIDPGCAMIILLHPRSTSPRSRRFPLSVLSLAAMIEGREDYAIVDGNADPHPERTLDRIMSETPADVLAVSVMPGPQMVAATSLCQRFRRKYPAVAIVWGGYFPSLFPDTTLAADYVDFVVRGQGEDTFVDFLAAYRGDQDYRKVLGLSFRSSFGVVHTGERPMRPPGEYPWLPYHRLPDVECYILPTFLGSRTAVHQASVGCPFKCNFCAVVPLTGSRQKQEPPDRTAAVLAHLKERYAINAVQFYDNNFFLGERHTRDLMERLEPLDLRWWCEARIDIVLKYSDETLRAIRRAGCMMIFFGVESGSDATLREMNKQLTSAEILALAARIRKFGIVPEYSFIFGNPRDAERDVTETIAFIRKIKKINPEVEIIVQTFVPTPQRNGTYGDVDIEYPATPDEWATERWFNFAVRVDPELPWLPRKVRRRIRNFETVINARWPTTQDIRLSRWGRLLLKVLGSWRYAAKAYHFPIELKVAQRLVRLRQPRVESL